MRNTVVILLLAAVLARGLDFKPSTASPYQLDLRRDAAVCIAVTGLSATGLYLESRVASLDESAIALLRTGDINAFDRSAARNRSVSAASISNVTVALCMASPALYGLSAGVRRDWLTVGVLYFETMGATNALASLSKGLVKRTRPFVYNSRAPLSDKEDPDARKSFFSNHSCNAFASAVFFSTLFAGYFPESNKKWAVWTASLSAAAATGFLRYQAGKHFPTDILTGAAVGSAAGAGVPWLHRKKPGDRLGMSVVIGEQNRVVLTRSF